jgi:hypothetical protein
LIRCGRGDHAAQNSDGCRKKQSGISHLSDIASHIDFVIRSKMTVVSFPSAFVSLLTFELKN